MDSTSSQRRRLIVNADDFGLSPAVTTGIIEAAEAGGVTSASMIVNLDGFEAAGARARAFGGLPLGLHLNLTSGQPLTQMRSLRGSNGLFAGMRALLWRATLGLVDKTEVANECIAQLDRMLDAGLHPTHLNSHRHVHVHPALFPAIVAAAASRGVSIVRVPVEPLRTNLGNWRATLKKIGLSASAQLRRARERVEGPDHFFGISLQGGEDFGSRVFTLIAGLPEGTSELMTHPGRVDAMLEGCDSYTWQREKELSTLVSPEFRELLHRCDVELTTFENLRSDTVWPR